MDRKGIEAVARGLLADIYREEQQSRPGVLHPMQMLEPALVARHLDLTLEYVESLGRWKRGDADFEIAGPLDQRRGLIHVSTVFPHEVARFTAAHEIGHVQLGHPGRIIHRDRPVFNLHPGSTRPVEEQEAGYFAACLLAPRRLVVSEYQKRFPVGPPLPLSDAVAFNLCGESAHKMMSAGPESYLFAATVASARMFNGRPFRSLAETFNISTSAMAIRLRELELIDG